VIPFEEGNTGLSDARIPSEQAGLTVPNALVHALEPQVNVPWVHPTTMTAANVNAGQTAPPVIQQFFSDDDLCTAPSLMWKTPSFDKLTTF